MIVIKFGGTSVGDANRVANAIDIVAERRERKPVVVVSALAGVTNELVAATEAARACDIDRVNEIIGTFIFEHVKSPALILLLINVFLLIVGCFMETIAAITILVPVLLPLMAKIGVDPVHFGLIMVLNLMIGLLTPPVGMVLYILARVSGISFERTTKACLPFLIPLLVSLAIVTYWPAMVMYLPNLFYK